MNPTLAKQNPQIRSGGTSRFKLTTNRQKFMWQSGWFGQHQRLLQMLGGQASREGVVLSGDLHATGHARIRSSADAMLDSPVHAILTGPIGTKRGWPSASRGTPPLLATGIDADTPAPVSERNGFTLIDLTQDEATIQLFAWRNEPVACQSDPSKSHEQENPASRRHWIVCVRARLRGGHLKVPCLHARLAHRAFVVGADVA